MRMRLPPAKVGSKREQEKSSEQCGHASLCAGHAPFRVRQLPWSFQVLQLFSESGAGPQSGVVADALVYHPSHVLCCGCDAALTKTAGCPAGEQADDLYRAHRHRQYIPIVSSRAGCCFAGWTGDHGGVRGAEQGVCCL